MSDELVCEGIDGRFKRWRRGAGAQPGDVFVSSSWNRGLANALPTLIRFFTHVKGLPDLSHSGVIGNDYNGTLSCFEAGVAVQVVPFKRNYRDSAVEEYWVYRLKKATPEDKQRALKYIYEEFSGVVYNPLQLVWFMWRWFNERVLCRDIRRQKNWMTADVICSEVDYWYLCMAGAEYNAEMRWWNADTIQPADLRSVFIGRPDLFELVEAKERATWE